MKIYFSPSNQPAHNIATEEYLIRQSDDEIIFLYINSPSVIVGKHQNAFSEIDDAVVKKNGIDVIRRLSGGGAVYHDFGNLNYTHIKSVYNDQKVDFHAFLTPLMEALKTFGVETEIGPRNNLLLEGKKITGTACHTIKSRVMHHGTLLFNADLTVLNKVLLPVNTRYTSKAVKSVSSTVTNILEHLAEPKTLDDLVEHLLTFFHQRGAELWQPEASATEYISALIDEKYSQWSWNYAYSPRFDYQHKDQLWRIEKGMVVQIKTADNVEISENWIEEYVNKPFHPERLI